MSSYSFQIDMQCPQCGAPVVLEETECIIRCRFCRTSNIIHTHPYPCYYMEPGQKKFAGLPVVYVPYWRFKGLEFRLGTKQPGFRVIDHSYLAVDKIGLPVSLGLRSQTQKLKFIQKGVSGSFLMPGISRKEILKQIAGSGEKKIHIGEILSLVFMPFYQDTDIMYDGLSGKAVAMHPSCIPAHKKSPVYHLGFTPGLCPNCGWDLEGETDSLVLCCSNCTSFWLIHNKKLNKFQAMFYDTGPDTNLQIQKISKHWFHPADLSLEEGFQAVLPVLMSLCIQKKEIWNFLVKEKLKLKSFSLTYVPFRTSGSEYIQDTLGLSLPINSLKFGRQL